ncbi:hypothetical protein CAPTEDRAFT_152663 [Capitella teleta]|uniref:Neurotransmitter-gated ion-channel ligand-binding domain-containing protein n=1 Tax=Capitella teleta TaxID=283909 RepID=R7V9V0_CAPTE|nr:hypothetical protein CAPTEDRAFT_152663 [Capitella teleta]|eukprot:ELU15277.1 hypothetical protein CAPTEDRAFT_152663 [Capitella teleta]
MHIKELDVRSQIFTTTGLLILEWMDERLRWSPEDHNDLKEIFIEAEKLWRPEFAVINGAEKIYEEYDPFRAVINYNGTVHWEPGGVFKTMCAIDITFYPFDEQMCKLQFGAWSYHTHKMNLYNSSTTVNKDTYNENGEWHIDRTEVLRETFAYECCPNEPFANVAFHIYLRRRHTFYVMNVILPSIMTSVLLLSIFFCTPGQKVQIGVVVLLSFRIFLLNVSADIPKTSDHIPLLGIYLTCTMAITTMSMVLTVFVLNLHHITDRPVPDWARRFILLYLARMLGMNATSPNATASSNDPLKRKPKADPAKDARMNNAFFRRRPSPLMEIDSEERSAIIELQHRNASPSNGGALPPHTHFDIPRAPNREGFTPDISVQSPMLSGYSRLHRAPESPSTPAEEKIEDYSKDWKRMAEVFDRLFFWLFLLAILISTLVLFHPLTNVFVTSSSASRR